MLSDSKDSKVYKKKPHRKVKSGCGTCKRRKIKCDEEKPQCSNCARYHAECVYPSPTSEARDHVSTSMSVTPDLGRSPESTMEESPLPQYPRGSQDVPMRDLALMHQWCISTCHGFGDEFWGASDPWRVDIPLLAQHSPFLMRGILAISALHIARTTTDQLARMQYIQLAAYHQNLALPEYRTAIVDVTESSVTAVIAFSALTTVYSFVAPKDPSSLFAPGPRHWIFLHQGVREIPPHWATWIERGPLYAQIHRRRLQPIDPSFNPEDFRLQSLQRMLSNVPFDGESELVHYQSALYWLRQAFAHTFCLESRLTPKYAVLFWIEHVSQRYLDLLRSDDPYAMVLFAHSSVLLKSASGFWFWEGFAEYFLADLREHLREEFLPWIEWPLETCGVI